MWIEQLFGPLDKIYCIYFSLLSISGFLLGIFLILFLIIYPSIIKKTPFIIHIIVISFIIYFQNRLLFNMCINEKNTIETFGNCNQSFNINQWNFLMKFFFRAFFLKFQRMQGDGTYKCNLPASCPIPGQKPFCLSTGGWACDFMTTPYGIENIKS
jgi:hypothetical protein